MADGVEVQIDGIMEVSAKLEAYGRLFNKELQRVIEKYAIKVEEDAKKNAPVDTGRLRASIHRRLEEMAAEVIAGTDYAAFVEFGTGRRGAVSQQGEVPEGYNHGPSPGMSAQPYLRPALEKHRSNFVRDVRQIHNRISGSL